MPKLLNLITGHARDEREVRNALMRLDREKLPVRVEIESQNLHFYTRLSIRSGAVVVAKPLGLKTDLKKGAMVRFRVPGTGNRELRMEVVTPHFNLTSGSAVFLCRVPTEFVAGVRSTVRYNTSRFTNVAMALPVYPQPFRVVDISLGGCKLYLPSQEASRLFKVGDTISGGRLHLGERVSVELARVIPRSFHAQTVGCQMDVKSEGPNRKVLEHLIKSLEKAEIDRLRG